MKRQISILTVCMLLAVISANTVMAITFSGVPNSATLYSGDSETFTIQITDAIDKSHIFEIEGVEDFEVTVNSVLIDPTTWSTTWSGTDSPIYTITVKNVNVPNGDYEMDLLHDATVTGHATLSVPITTVPEFPTIALPVAAILGLAFIFQRRREED